MLNLKKKNDFSKTYNFFLFFSTFTRGLTDVFSLVLLAKKGFTAKELIFFLFILYSVGIIVNYISLKISYKIVLVVSSLLYGISFLYLSCLKINLTSLIIFACLLSFSSYSYHAIRHLLAFEAVTKANSSKNFVFITYLGVICSSLGGSYFIEKLPFYIIGFVIFSLSLLSFLPILKLPTIHLKQTNKVSPKIPKTKIMFSIFEQFKVIFLELQPLFLYLYVDQSIYYVGIFNVIVNIASLITLYFLADKISKNKFKYFNLILGLVLIFKLNINNALIILLLAFFEGIFVKIYEMISLDNLYDYSGNNVSGYLLKEEIIFFTTKSAVIFACYLFRVELKVIMYICIVGLIISGLFIKEKK